MEVSQQPITTVRDIGGGNDCLRRAEVKVCFGTDLLGSTYTRQCREFTLRSEVFSPLEILRQATSVSAEMLLLEGQIGCIAPCPFQPSVSLSPAAQAAWPGACCSLACAASSPSSRQRHHRVLRPAATAWWASSRCCATGAR